MVRLYIIPRSLSIGCACVVLDAVAEESGWARGFSNVVWLKVLDDTGTCTFASFRSGCDRDWARRATLTRLGCLPQCRVPASHQKSPTTSSTSCPSANAKLSKRVALSLNRGFHVPVKSFSVESPSVHSMISRPGKTLFQIPSIRPHVIPALCPSVAPRSFSLQLSKRVIGSRHFVTLNI